MSDSTGVNDGCDVRREPLQQLFRIAGNTFSVRIDVTSNTFAIPDLGPSNTHVFNVTNTAPMSGTTTTVNMGFYYLQCTP